MLHSKVILKSLTGPDNNCEVDLQASNHGFMSGTPSHSISIFTLEVQLTVIYHSLLDNKRRRVGDVHIALCCHLV